MRLAAIAALICATLQAAHAQTASAPTSAPASELPASVTQSLEELEDFALHFDQPGFYALLRHVDAAVEPPGHARQPILLDDWRELLERPSEFRGRPVTIEARVGRNKPWRHTDPSLRDLGPVWQLELSRRDQPIACTFILTEPADDIAIGSTVRITGYFAMIRRYYTQTHRLQPAALFVAQAPTAIITTAQPSQDGGRMRWFGLLIALTLGMLLAWVLLRRGTSRRSVERATPHAEHAAPFSVADDLAQWAQKDRPDADESETPPPTPPTPPTQRWAER